MSEQKGGDWGKAFPEKFDFSNAKEQVRQLLAQGKGGVIDIGKGGMEIQFSPDQNLDELIGRVKDMATQNYFDNLTITVREIRRDLNLN